MKNITVSVDKEVYRQARIWVAQNGTSVSRIVTYFLKTLPQRKLPAQFSASSSKPTPSSTSVP